MKARFWSKKPILKSIDERVLNWWKGKPSGSIACTRKQQPRFYWSCSSVVMMMLHYWRSLALLMVIKTVLTTSGWPDWNNNNPFNDNEINYSFGTMFFILKTFSKHNLYSMLMLFLSCFMLLRVFGILFLSKWYEKFIHVGKIALRHTYCVSLYLCSVSGTDSSSEHELCFFESLRCMSGEWGLEVPLLLAELCGPFRRVENRLTNEGLLLNGRSLNN